eukprot:c34907_g1_i1 orf=2-214(-)
MLLPWLGSSEPVSLWKQFTIQSFHSGISRQGLLGEISSEGATDKPHHSQRDSHTKSIPTIIPTLQITATS